MRKLIDKLFRWFGYAPIIDGDFLIIKEQKFDLKELVIEKKIDYSKHQLIDMAEFNDMALKLMKEDVGREAAKHCIISGSYDTPIRDISTIRGSLWVAIRR